MKSTKLLFLFTIAWVIFSGNAMALKSFSDPMHTKIESWIQTNFSDSQIPGMSVVVVNADQVLYQGNFGVADQKSNQEVTSKTLFELSSNSKAFTALAILQLEKIGKLHLSDPISQYFPWLTFRLKGKTVEITLEQFLHHSTGIPFQSIGQIPQSDSDSALEETVRTLIETELEFEPGKQYSYATINYDVLGLLVEEVSQMTFEDYVSKNVLGPLGLHDTHVSQNEIPQDLLSKGHKFSFLTPKAYQAPPFRGNLPAGYFISNSADMSQWLMVQLGKQSGIVFDTELIKNSHQPDRTVPPSQIHGGASYAAGWLVHQKGKGEISHGGNNPNYSSFVAFRPGEQVGVAVLANMNSPYAHTIGQGILNLLIESELPQAEKDFLQNLDQIASTILFMMLSMALLSFFFIIRHSIDIFRLQISFQGKGKKLLLSLFAFVGFLSVLSFCLFQIPEVLYNGMNWNFIVVWAPISLPYATVMTFGAIFLFSFYFLLTTHFPKQHDKSLFALVVLSIASGIGNALVIFTVNETLNHDGGFQSGLFMYFSFAIALYIFGQKLVRTRLVKIANSLVYQKRAKLIDKILGTPFQNFESIEDGKIQASLNSDTETVSEFANIIITGATSLVTLLCCFLYIGMINFYGLLISLAVILAAVGLYYVIGNQANRLWEQTRDIQNVFFRFINELNSGFKELSLHSNKQKDFKADMLSSCSTYKEKRIQGDMKFANVTIVGELLFTLVIGAVAFSFPILFDDIQSHSLRTYVFVFLYMTGPIHGILQSIPEIFKVRISWNRINQLAEELETLATPQSDLPPLPGPSSSISLELSKVQYLYDKTNSNAFGVGPLDIKFQSGQITFITGGNGSGKSTLAKLISGLYAPDHGDIYLNNKKIAPTELSQYFSAIFSDFFLFKKLYGIDYPSKQMEINRFLNTMAIQDKVNIDEGVFDHLNLSTGQKKRLALMISHVEDRPVYLFDEWAADQDPEFRQFFYQELLPEFKRQGKCVIAITHDDRYFNVADNIIKMDMGEMVQQ